MDAPESSPGWKAFGAWILAMVIIVADFSFAVIAKWKLTGALLIGHPAVWSSSPTAPLVAACGVALLIGRPVLLLMLLLRARVAVAGTWFLSALALLQTAIYYLGLPVPEGEGREVWVHWGTVVGAHVGVLVQTALMITVTIYAARRGVLNFWGGLYGRP